MSQAKQPEKKPSRRPGEGKKPFLLTGSIEEPAVAFLSPGRVELLGNRQAVVDGCRGIIEYSDTCIRLSAQGLILKFTGTGLEIRAFTDSEAIVAGTILGLEYS